MASDWQQAAAQQAEEVSARLRELLTSGLGLLHSRFGLELGLQPDTYPAWVFLAVPAIGGLLMLLMLLHCASSSSSSAQGKPDREPAALPNKAPALPAAIAKPAKAEEPKKKNKKKPQPDKAKPNGRPVELAEETVTAVKKESPKPSDDTDKKNEKAKKAKKKLKADVKPTQQSPSQEKKEAEEGNWEMKISNKEKRQQRKRDKGADSDFPETAQSVSESFAPPPPQTTSIRKAKGSSEVSAVNGSGWNEKPTKVITSQVIEEKWVPVTAGKKKNEPCTWNQDAVESNAKDWTPPWNLWTAVETRITSSEPRQPHFSTIGLNSTVSAVVSDPVPQVSDGQWDAVPLEPSFDDEWSGLNGLSSTDAGSDWKAPAEEWGNYGEEEPVSAPEPEPEPEPEQELQKVSDDDKEKEDGTAQTAAGSKTKKKKKKKKKQGEESGSPTQEADGIIKEALNDYKMEPTPAPPPVVIPKVVPKVVPKVIGKSPVVKEAVKETRPHAVTKEASVSEKSPVVKQPQESSSAPAKQNSVPPPQSQAKSEESWESPKQVKKKKKARRET